MQLKNKNALAGEFFRYLLVGGSAFCVDFFTMLLCEEWLLRRLPGETVFLATAIGFLVGLTYNYLLSVVFVFQNASQKIQGRQGKAFLLFAVIGIFGLGLTELGMYLGVRLLGFHYLLTKVVVAGVVLLWNYFARKIIIFR